MTAKDIIRLLSRPGSHVILVFLTPGASTQFQGEPLQRGHKTQGRWEIFFQFSTEIAVYLGNGTARDIPMECYGMIIGSHMRSIEW